MSPAAEDQNPQTALRRRVASLVERVLEGRGTGTALSREATLSELGVSSLEMVSLMLSLEVEFDLNIPQSEITPENFRSISTVQALVTRLIAARA